MAAPETPRQDDPQYKSKMQKIGQYWAEKSKSTGETYELPKGFARDEYERRQR